MRWINIVGQFNRSLTFKNKSDYLKGKSGQKIS